VGRKGRLEDRRIDEANDIGLALVLALDFGVREI
jgi:hypothetical protein